MLDVLEDRAMVNKIHDSGIKTIEYDGSLKARNQAKKESVPENTVSADKVNISEISKQLEAIKASFKDMPEVDSIKVAHFKAQIEAGNYQINSGDIANKMLHNFKVG